MRSIQLLTLSVIFTLTGCLSLAPDYQRPAAPVPQQFSLSQNKLVTATAGYQETGWRTFFVDPQVKSLISTALTNNRDLRMATLKVQEARAQYRVTDADRYPQLNGDGSTTYGGKLKGDTTTSSDYAAGLNLSYDLDFFGRLKNLSEADRQNFFASEEARRAVHILLIANVSQSYFNQRLASAILLQRPDILEAEHSLQAANANIGAARAAFFPSITLTSSLSGSSSELSSLFNAGGAMWNFIPKIELPIFNAGRNQASLDLAEIRQQQQVVNYEQKIQSAFKEVADALALRQSVADQIAAQQRYLASLNITLQRATALYRHGAVSYIEVLSAQRDIFTTRQTLLNEGEIHAVAILHIVELRLRGDGEAHGHRRPVHRRDGLVGDSDFFVIHINSFDDAFAADALRLRGGVLLVHRHTCVRGGGLGGEHRAREQGEQGDFR